MRRIAGLITGALTAAALLVGCAGTTTAPETTSAAPTPSATATTPAERTTITIASLKGPTTMGLVKLMSDAEAGKGLQDYQATMYATPDEVVPKVVQGQVDIAMVPSNLAAVLYNKTLTDAGAAVQVAAVNTLGVLELLEAGDTVKTWADLKGKTIYISGKGASPEYTLNFLLRENGLDPATDVTVEYKSEPTEVAAVLAATPGAVGVLPQPFATVLTMQTPSVRPALDFTDEWTKVAPDSQLVMGVVIVRTAFLTEHPQAFADFLTDYQASVKFTNDDPAAAGELIAAAGIVPKAAIAAKAIPACNITFVDGAEMKSALDGYLKVLFAADPASVGGSLPGDDFYVGS